MASRFNKFADAPNQIAKEGAEIVLKFTRNGNGTATITWNIPTPSAGCGSDNPAAYDGIVITVADSPVNYLTTSPADGTYYNADITVNKDSHSGDSIDYARVIGAFYHDRTTTSLIVTDVLDKTPYFVSAYAVDSVGRYHREGVHAYSIPTGEKERPAVDSFAYQDVLVDILGGVRVTSATGLDLDTTYTLVLNINDEEYEISIPGTEVISIRDLVEYINKELSKIGVDVFFPVYPYSGEIYVDVVNKIVYQWTGTTNTVEESTFSEYAPDMLPLDTYWLDTDSGTLYQLETAGWVESYVISRGIAPNDVSFNDVWYDGTDAWRYNGSHWCKLVLYDQERNPLLPPEFTGNTFWYNTTASTLNIWNQTTKAWEASYAIVGPVDPNLISNGDFWFNETDERMYVYDGSAWAEPDYIRYEEPNGDGTIENTLANGYWYVPSTQEFFQRDAFNIDWIEVDYTLADSDPTVRMSCDLWWDTTLSMSGMFTWDEINAEWVVVDAFYEQATDPNVSSFLDYAVWRIPSTGELKYLELDSCSDLIYIDSIYNPLDLPVGVVWFNSETSVYMEWNGVDWVAVDVIQLDSDPQIVAEGEYWYDTSSGLLYIYESSTWVLQDFVTTPTVPDVGTVWYDTTEDERYQWNGAAWIESDPIATVEFNVAVNPRSRAWFRFKTRSIGCGSIIEVDATGALNPFANTTWNVIYMTPIEGASGLVSGPSYKQLGVGTDGSPDERRALHDSIRVILGHPIQVELTKENIDECIDNALLMLRKYSSYAYKRGYFFLDVFRNQQTYILTNRCVGFNKIVKVHEVYRMRGNFLTTAFNGNDLFGFAALQQLYTTGTYDMLSYYIVSSYVEDLERMFATKIMHHWNETNREIKLMNNIPANSRVMLDVAVERTEQELFTDRETALWVKKWATAEAKMTLSQIRGKFTTLPGPNGSTTLNAQELITQAETEKQALMEEILDPGMQDMAEIGMNSAFVFG